MHIKGNLSLLILHVLSLGPNHGYEISKFLREKSNNILDYKEGTLYPTLHRLEDKAMITSEKKRVNGRERKVYYLTDNGRNQLQVELKAWQDYTESVQTVLAITR